MNQIIEFVGNHTLLILAFFATLGMLLYSEFMRISTASSALSPYAATALMNEGSAVLLDIREEKEFKNGHVLNAKNFPMTKLDARMHEIDKFKTRDVVVYCESGMRSSRAIAKLKKNGFEKLHNLQGGLAAWEKANLPTVTK